MSFPPYPAYQDSGVSGLGKVPDHWEVTRLKRACSVFASNVDKKSVEGQDSVLLCNYTDVYYNDLIEAALPFMEATATNDQIERFSLRAGDTIITKDSESPDDIARSAYVPTTLPGVICGYHLSMVRPLATAHGPFIKRYFDSAQARAYFHTNANGLTRVGLGQYALDNAPIALPSLAEQIAIAAFLDRETAKIDLLVEEQRRLIALLKEKRQAVIFHAVTKGLDPHVPMKGSGIEWLGEVPAHWGLKAIKWLSPVLRGASPRPIDDPRYFDDDGEYAWVRIADSSASNGLLTTTTQRLSELGSALSVKLEPGSLFVSIAGTVGKPCVTDIKACIHDGFVYFPKLTIDNRWLYRIFEAGLCYGGLGKLGTQLNLNTDTIGSIVVGVPDEHEMAEILQFIDEQTRSIDGLIGKSDELSGLLQERRAALISAAVTGKIDVRGSAKVLPFPINRARACGLIATEIIERSAHQTTFGRVKFQKIAFLAEAHVGVSELAGSYTREAAGPLDRALIDEMEGGAQSIAGIEHEQPGGTGTMVSYRLGQQRGAHRVELVQWLGAARTAKLDKLISDFAGLTTREAEAVATLYGVWNDALSEGTSPTDEEIISGFINDWHPEKQSKFRASELPEWLGWMRRHGIVPTGSGPTTSTGRLFV